MTSTKTLLLCVAAGVACGFAGYRHGVTTTAHEWSATLAQEQAERLREDKDRALAMVGALQKVSERTLDASRRADALEAELLDAADAIEAERKAASKRIAHATESAAALCPGLPPEWVREYNEATACALPGAGDPHRPGHPDSAGSAPDAGTSGPAIPGLPQGQSLTPPEDVLAHIRDYGAYCKRLEHLAFSWDAFSGVLKAAE